MEAGVVGMWGVGFEEMGVWGAEVGGGGELTVLVSRHS